MSFETCPYCGCRVYKLGCVNCNEAAYIEEQECRNQEAEQAQEAEERAKAEADSEIGR